MRSAMLKGLMVVLRGSENFLPLASMVQRPPSSSVRRSGRMRVMTPSSTVTFTMPPMQQLMNSCSAIEHSLLTDLFDAMLLYASHLATSTRQEFCASPGTFLDTILDGRQQVDAATPVGAARPCPAPADRTWPPLHRSARVPGRMRSVTCAAQMTVPRSLKTLTMSPSLMPRAAASDRVDAHRPPGVTVLLDAVLRDVVQPVGSCCRCACDTRTADAGGSSAAGTSPPDPWCCSPPSWGCSGPWAAVLCRSGRRP